ncbi:MULTISPECIES: MarR family winged helix-turn-helix transcriptional regulator [unclassified Mycolicibacterium]|nr:MULTISPECIES: MarR family transcriptional regulator [unclassified Mycolicibacterium]MUM40244.1 MarR family transcriptional regulator [Mycolicibacterium sp. CBMA 247]MUL85638.1 MarR family transcriptional regulator [Mycolicibacterium sp. CBMA 329]MUL88597.1 MarR family transcriptional regulator [Mycolicibacterium sp. CBMA 331]MUM02106.1 MarR family transcriptional regulator [Mycolicibacterium sp. CBMA 334]MUM29282.1 MarR family transcriptional regulator [Mycolicibacterium sp. CBMA 295]
MSTEFAELASLLLDRAARLERVIGASLSGTGLAVPHWLILGALHRASDGLTMTGLANVVGLPGATLTRSVDRLVDQALLHRTVDALDRRRVLVHLTDRGRSSYHAVAPRVDEAVEAQLSNLAAWEHEALAGLLAKRS